MERDMPQSPSIASKTRKKILSHWDEERDTLTEEPGASLGWKSADDPAFPYEHGRGLPKPTAQKAIDYIDHLTRKYPFQIRYAMALPYWHRFAQAWCETGDEKKALRAI
jgi:hypothetical protein